MSSDRRMAQVRLDGHPVGHLREYADRYEFRYDPAWCRRPDATPVSLTMPLREEPYVSRQLHPFFENQLPEGWLLEISTAKLKISRDDAFGILLACCADCYGAVEIVSGGGE